MLQVQITFSLHRGDKLLRIGEMYKITAFLKNIGIWLKKVKEILKIDCFLFVKNVGILNIKGKVIAYVKYCLDTLLRKV